MIRNVDHLLSFKINFEVTSSLKYQELMEMRKLKIEEEELPENLLNDYMDDLPGWESLEHDAWKLMQENGFNWKLFVLWIECNVESEGWDDCVVILNIFKDILLKKSEILNEEDNDEKKLLLIDYFDKAIARCLLYSYVKHEHPLIDYIKCQSKGNHSNLYDILSVITNKDYESYKSMITLATNIIDQLEHIFESFTIHCNKIKDVLMKLDGIMNLYEEYFLTINEEEIDEKQIKSEAMISTSNFLIDSKEEAYKKILEALEILKKVDHHELAIPLLRKIMRWKTKNISEIINEINNKEGAYYILTFLMD